ncbi:uncharacterized protein LOC126667759 isoform X2 [Mercurialis annua]|uniref:uncharacterized protein LOC126667759 isoform X2 n=1 Tax=Mercurialis annua TaxID=3986 RepID=UPI002160C2DC|nr:uncharacterized protein LOC126667759 isoform X2 [Mercurialis annua]
MSNSVQQAIHELKQFRRKSKSSSIQRRLSFHIKELKKSLCNSISLRVWLELYHNRVVRVVRVPWGEEPESRLINVAKTLIRGFLKDFRTLYLQGKAHGRITLDNIVVHKGTAMLINSQDLVGNLFTLKADFAAIATVIREMVGSYPCPKDLSHFLKIILREEPPTGTLQAFIFNHPAFWSNNKIVRNVIAIKLSYCHCRVSNRTKWGDTASQIPKDVTVNWKSLVQNSSTYKAVFDGSPTNYDDLVDGLALLVFFRNCLLHAHKKRYALTQHKIAAELCHLFPDFMAHFIEKTYCIADVREICMR